MAIKNGSKVSVHYKLTVNDKVIDSSEGKEPLQYTHGEKQMVPGFEREITGMEKGGKKSFAIAPEDGYGPRRSEAVQKVPKDAFKEVKDLTVGMPIGVQSTDGHDFQAIVTEIADDTVTLDLNHPLAGMTLNFDVEIVEVEEN